MNLNKHEQDCFQNFELKWEIDLLVLRFFTEFCKQVNELCVITIRENKDGLLAGDQCTNRRKTDYENSSTNQERWLCYTQQGTDVSKLKD
mmetsp:Transcript_5011/g.18070  ORF Transcript_5011/g.18070 Transcript_5011/m.18070 type:complete len:90 (-) Transcript_5011:531-800(-)